MSSLDLPANTGTVPWSAACAPMLPLPIKFGGALLWRRAEIEVWKAVMFDLPPPDLVTAQPMEFVTARQLAGELKVGIRTLRRRTAEARAAAAEGWPGEPGGRSGP
jgi:hypothetical protein